MKLIVENAYVMNYVQNEGKYIVKWYNIKILIYLSFLTLKL